MTTWKKVCLLVPLPARCNASLVVFQQGRDKALKVRVSFWAYWMGLRSESFKYKSTD